jgi:hypothetical protein
MNKGMLLCQADATVRCRRYGIDICITIEQPTLQAPLQFHSVTICTTLSLLRCSSIGYGLLYRCASLWRALIMYTAKPRKPTVCCAQDHSKDQRGSTVVDIY